MEVLMIARFLLIGIACMVVLGAPGALLDLGEEAAVTAQAWEVSYEDVRALIETNDGHSAEGWNYLVDVRWTIEFDEGHIQDSISIPYGALVAGGADPIQAVANASDSIAYGFPIVVYGDTSDVRATTVAEALLALGYEQVWVYVGGIADWREVHNDYLSIGIESFIQWHASHFPFVDGDAFLIDVNPAGWIWAKRFSKGTSPER
jgi:rhodanese-related sulfurtransferase